MVKITLNAQLHITYMNLSLSLAGHWIWSDDLLVCLNIHTEALVDATSYAGDENIQ